MSSNSIYGVFPNTNVGPFHYLYRITNLVEQKHYYGIRTSKHILPQDDLGVKYFSSSTDKEFISDQKKHPENYRYKVIIITNLRKKAGELEIKIQKKFNVGVNKNFYNKAIHSSSGFLTAGQVIAKDDNRNALLVSVDDPRLKSGEFRGINLGKKRIYNPVLKKELLIYDDDPLPNGWFYGTMINIDLLGAKWIHNIELKKNKKLKSGEHLPNGWGYGLKHFNATTDGYKNIFNPELKKNRYLKNGEILPEGWFYGRKNYSGNTYIHNPEMKQNTLLKIEDPLPDGWFYGKKSFQDIIKRTIPIFDPVTKEHKMIRNNDSLPEGWFYSQNNNNKKWIYNPTLKKETLIAENIPLPNGWFYGRKNYINVTHGSKWIYNPELKQNKRLKSESPLPDGWFYGRKTQWS